MSARCTAAVFARYAGGGGEFALALALADNAHDDGTHIYPGLETMAHKSRQDVRSVQRHLKRMLDAGWLILVRPGVRGPSGQAGRYTEYRINPRWLRGDNLSSIPADPCGLQSDDTLSPQFAAPCGPGKGDNLSPKQKKGVTNDAERGDKRCTPYKNPKNLTPPNPPLAVGAPGLTEPPNTEQPGPGFDAIAAAYPRRARINLARDQWAELNPSPMLQAAMLRAIEAWRRSAEWQREQGRYIPRLDKWLADGRWKDAPGAAGPITSPVADPGPPDLPPPAPIPAESRAKIDQLLGRTPIRKAVPA